MQDLPADLPGPITIENRQPVFSGFRKLYAIDYRHEEKDADRLPGTQNREIADIGEIAAILPYDPKRDVLVLLRQVRIGAHLAGIDSHMVEIAAGMVDPGETNEAAARRELLEEAGVTALDLIEAHRFMPSPGFTTELATLYCAHVDASNVPAFTGERDEGELIETLIVPVADAIAALDSGKYFNGYTTLALLWFARNRDRLRSVWMGES